MTRLFELYGLSKKHEIVSYNTNIYDLYRRMFLDMNPEAVDTLQFFKEHEKDINKKKIFDEKYSDIILIFDFDPQEQRFSKEAITRLLNHFNESTDNGKLFINYPMIESFYHLKSIPDLDYNTRVIEKQYLSKDSNSEHKTYKQIVGIESIANHRKSFPNTRKDSNIIIKQNIEKAKVITGINDVVIPPDTAILEKQLQVYNEDEYIYVLCTCAFYIADYNPTLLEKY